MSEKWFIASPGLWENDKGPLDWWAIGHEDDGILAYAQNEPMAVSILRKLQQQSPIEDDKIPTEKCIVVIGNFAEGYTFYGPYNDFSDAADSAEGSYSESWIATLEDPSELDSEGE